jgi:hypothetical protein
MRVESDGYWQTVLDNTTSRAAIRFPTPIARSIRGTPHRTWAMAVAFNSLSRAASYAREAGEQEPFRLRSAGRVSARVAEGARKAPGCTACGLRSDSSFNYAREPQSGPRREGVGPEADHAGMVRLFLQRRLIRRLGKTFAAVPGSLAASGDPILFSHENGARLCTRRQIIYQDDAMHAAGRWHPVKSGKGNRVCRASASWRASWQVESAISRVAPVLPTRAFQTARRSTCSRCQGPLAAHEQLFESYLAERMLNRLARQS